jgi:cytochrome c-type biogenesis protein CcmH
MKNFTHKTVVLRRTFVYSVLLLGVISVSEARAEQPRANEVQAASSPVNNASFNGVLANPPATDVSNPLVLEVSKELINPCEGCGRVALDQSPTCQTGKKYRTIVAEQLAKGKTKQQVIDYFAETYGEQMLGTPRPQGFNQAALIIPAVAVLLGALPLGLILTRRKKVASHPVAQTRASDAKAADGQAPTADAQPEEDPRIAAALRDADF